MLLEEERRLVDALYSRGPAALLEQGYTVETASAFMARADVIERLQLLDREYRSNELLGARQRFVARRDLAQFLPASVAILAKGLYGPTYLRDKDGVILRDSQGNPRMTDPGPTPVQMHSATQILDRLGVEAPSKRETTPHEALDLVGMIGAVAVKKLPLEDSNLPTPEERALSRERVRNAIHALIANGAVKEGHKKVMAAVTTAAKRVAGKKGAAKAKPDNNVLTDE